VSFKRMNRMVSFRVSQDEFELLRTKSEAVGARSVSDYARVALCGAATNAPNGSDIHDLNNVVQKLRDEILRLSELLDDPGTRYSNGDAVTSNHNGGVGNA